MLALAELARQDRPGVSRSKEWGEMKVRCNLRGTSTSISARKGFSLSWEYDPLVADRVNRQGLLTTAAGGRLNLVPPQDFEDPAEDVTPAWVTGLFAGGCGPSRPAQEKRPTGFAPEPEVAKEQSREGSRARIARALGLQGSGDQEQIPEKVIQPAQYGRPQKQRIERVCGFLKQFQAALAFFTGTIDDETARLIGEIENGWGTLLSNFHRMVTAEMRANGLPVFWLDVAELQVKRYRQTGTAAMHCHMVLMNKKFVRKNAPWVIRVERMQELWHRAVKMTTGRMPVGAECRTELKRIEKDAAAYLSKYVSKTKDLDQVVWEKCPGMCPRQIVYQSPDVREQEARHTVVLTGYMVEWGILNSEVLKKQGIVDIRVFSTDDGPPGSQAVFRFNGVIELWAFWSMYARDAQFVNELRTRAFAWELPEDEFDPALLPGLPIPAVKLDSYRATTLPVSNSRTCLDQIREALERTFRDVDVAEPVLVGGRLVPVETSGQVQLFGEGFLSAEVHECDDPN